jgi:hypothetical protein
MFAEPVEISADYITGFKEYKMFGQTIFQDMGGREQRILYGLRIMNTIHDGFLMLGNLITLVSREITLGFNFGVGYLQIMGSLPDLLFQFFILGFNGPDSDNIEQVGG